MPSEEDPIKEHPDPINVLISIIKPGWKRALFLVLPIIGLIVAHFIYYSDPPSICINIIRLLLSIFTVLYIAVNIYVAYKKKSDIVDSFQKNQPQFFTIIVVLGGTLAILIPMIMNVTKLIGDGAPLTTALLGITGGIIAIFGYYKTHQKSELEREQLETQKQKDARDHIRQLHNSYNDRFDKAVAELYSDDIKAAYTAVPKLAKLADAWMDYEDLSNDTKELEKLKDKAEKEAQIIINILCKYIRTIPNNYTHEQLKEFKSLPESDIEILAHEADICRLIFSEISKRSSTFTKNGKGEIIETIPGPWSDFDFDFSRAPIFYPLNAITIEKGNFSSAKFYSNANFSGATFTQDADFREATFTQDADFRSATFTQNARFSVTRFTQDADFRWATFTQNADFRSATFTSYVDFRSVTFERFEPTFATKLGKAQFSAGTSPQNYMFSVTQGSKPIHCGWAKIHGKPFIIPVGTVLFDPGSGRTSGPAKPIEESDSLGEIPSK